MNKIETTFNYIKYEISQFLFHKGVTDARVTLEPSDILSHGDVSVQAALVYAKTLKQSPISLAKEISAYLVSKDIFGVADIQVAHPGFVNFFFSKEFFKEGLDALLVLGDSYGKNTSLAGQTWIVEHTSPNPNKAMHLGHLRNNLIGMSITNLLEWSGAHVVCEAVDNDRGISIAKLVWGFLSHMRKNEQTPVEVSYWATHPNEWHTPVDLGILPDIFVSDCYTSGANDYETDDIVKEKVRTLVADWDRNDVNVRKLWSHILAYSYQGINRTLTRLGNRWDKVWHESEHYEGGKEYVNKGLSAGIFLKLDDGAVLSNLSKYDLPDTIVLKSDGTSLYITQDIALTALKKKTYPSGKLVWVIGPEQSMAMKQMFAICEQLGIGLRSDFTHVSYGCVGLKDSDGSFKKMSSREGTVVLIDDIIDTVKVKITKQFSEVKTTGINKDHQKVLVEKMGLAAVKFSILKTDRNRDIAFDIKQSTETQGDSGIYVLYTYARTNSVLRKAPDNATTFEPKAIDLGMDLVRILLLFPEIIKRSTDELSAHHIAQYLLSVCSAFNKWYAQETILDGGENQDHKLAVTKAVRQVIKNGLSVMGIALVEEI